MKRLALRLHRVLVLAGVVWLIRAEHAAWEAGLPSDVEWEQVRDFYPDGERLGKRDPELGGWFVLDAFADPVGYVLKTLPEARSVIGYSGPSDTLVALDDENRIVGVRLLESRDTEEHVARVRADAGFWESFVGTRAGEAPVVRPVSGATLTSSAIARGVSMRLGAASRSFLFPYPVTLPEAQRLFPDATAVETEGSGRLRVTGADGVVLGYLLRTAPVADEVIGYRGPTDTLIALGPDGDTVVGLRVRESYETEEYLGYVTGDPTFLAGFAGRRVEDLAALDIRRDGIGGVSGATQTSLAVVEGVRRRLVDWVSRPEADSGADASGLWGGFVFRERDLVLALWVLVAVLVAFSRWRSNRLFRTVYQVGLVVYVGWVAGDMLSLSLWTGWAREGVPWRQLPGLALLTAAGLLVPWVSGRPVYCAHLCPHGAAQDLVRRGALRLGRRPVVLPPGWLRVLGWIPGLLVLGLAAAVVAGRRFDLAAWEPFDAWVLGTAALVSFLLAGAGLLASAFVPMAYCRFGCPTGFILKFVGVGRGERWGRRDLLVSVLVVAAVLWQVAGRPGA